MPELPPPQAVRLTRTPVCGNEQCCTSTDIADNLTHGWGRLDNHGFWEHPCPEVEKHAEHDREFYAWLEASRLKAQDKINNSNDADSLRRTLRDVDIKLANMNSDDDHENWDWVSERLKYASYLAYRIRRRCLGLQA